MPIDHLIIPDTQVKPGVPMEHLTWIGKYIVDRKPEVVIHLGDHFDMPSLSSYDKGTVKVEGKRLNEDIAAGQEGMRALLAPIRAAKGYKPRLIYIPGNHDERVQRYADANPELQGTVGWHSLGLKEMGWEVYDYLTPVDVNGILYCHYFANPLSGRPYTANATNLLKSLGRSFVQGHRQVLDFGTRTLVDGSQQIGIIAGACYLHDEGYKGAQGNKHWRGVVVLHDVQDGFGNPMFVDLPYLERKYGKALAKAGVRSDEHDGASERSTRIAKKSDWSSKQLSKASAEEWAKGRTENARTSRNEGVPSRAKGVRNAKA